MRKSKILFLLAILMLTLAMVSACNEKEDNPANDNEINAIEDTLWESKEITVEEGDPADGFLWENNYSEITITGYEGVSNDLVVPSKINGKPVTQIKEGAFEGFTAMKSLKIPGSCKIIKNAANGCTGLTSVVLADGVEDISAAFRGCTSLTEVVLAESVKSMYEAFEGCEALISIEIPDNVTSLWGTFSGCSSLKEVNIPSGITTLGDTFSGCSSLTSITIPASVERISDETFKDCTSLVDISFPEKGKMRFDDYVFYGCTALKELKFPDGLEIVHIGACVLHYMPSLETLYIGTLSENLVLEGFFALVGCESIKNITAPEWLFDDIEHIGGCSEDKVGIVNINGNDVEVEFTESVY